MLQWFMVTFYAKTDVIHILRAFNKFVTLPIISLLALFKISSSVIITEPYLNSYLLFSLSKLIKYLRSYIIFTFGCLTHSDIYGFKNTRN